MESGYKTITWYYVNKNNEIIRMLESDRKPAAKGGNRWVRKVADFQKSLFTFHGPGEE